MTLVSCAFLIASFVLRQMNASPPVDPAWVTVVISGVPLIYLAVWRVIHNPGISKISSALLIDIAMIAAIAVGDLFAAGEVAFIMAIGAILEDMTTERAKKGIRKLYCLAPTQARRISAEGGEEMISADTIREGDILRVLPGESIPVDGIIERGETSVDQSVMTGESLPVDKGAGEEVFCGTVNRFGSVDIRASKVGSDTSLQKMVRLVQEAEQRKAPMQRIADRCASWLVPMALMIAVIAGIVTRDIVRAVTVLVVFCPCALVLATPTAIMAAIGQAAKHGVIIKSGEALERMGKIHMIAFDKTGTLTYGRPEVSDIIPAGIAFDKTALDGSFLSQNGFSAEEKQQERLCFLTSEEEKKKELLCLCASAEEKSEHPLGKAILDCAKKQGISLMNPENFRMRAGRGVFAEVSGRKILCGNEKFLREEGAEIDREMLARAEELKNQGKALIFTAAEGKCVGVLALSDVLRPEAADMVDRLKKMNTRSVLLTGDNRRAADYFAKKVGIPEVHGELLPEEKAEYIKKMQEEDIQVCMIGDGVNDALALKTADVGVAMGSMGSDLAIEAADIALMSDDISRIPYLKRLANATVNTIKLSITLSMCINFVAVTLSVLGALTPTTGALVHNAGSCFVVLIAALLYDRNFENAAAKGQQECPGKEQG